MNKSPKFKDSYFKARAKTWAVGQAVGAAAGADLREVSWGGRSRRPLGWVGRRTGWSLPPDRGLKQYVLQHSASPGRGHAPASR